MKYFRFTSVHHCQEAFKACGVPAVAVGLMLVMKDEPRNPLANQSTARITDDQREQLDREYARAYPTPPPPSPMEDPEADLDPTKTIIVNAVDGELRLSQYRRGDE